MRRWLWTGLEGKSLLPPTIQGTGEEKLVPVLPSMNVSKHARVNRSKMHHEVFAQSRNLYDIIKS